MITMPGGIKICSINDRFLLNQSYIDAVFQEHIKYFIFTSLQQCTEFKNTTNPIRVASSLSMVKRIVTPGSQVFKSTYPFGVMMAEQSENEELGALISPQSKAMKNMYIPQELTSMPILKRMKRIGIKDNIDVRITYRSQVYSINYTHYDVSRQKTYNTKQQWDTLLEPGRFYTYNINIESIVPKAFIYKFCVYMGVSYDLNWFIDYMNKHANPIVHFKLGMDSGTKLYEVFVSYPQEVLMRATSTSAPEVEEEGDIDKHWTITRSFLLSINVPTVLYFGRERDADLPDYIPSISEPLAQIEKDGALDDTRTTAKTSVPVENVATVSQVVQLTTVDEYDGYHHVASYDFSKDDLDYLVSSNINKFDVSIFKDVLKEDLEESIYYDYCKSLLLFDKKDNYPLKIVFKLNNEIVDYPILNKDTRYTYTIDNVSEIISSKKFTILIYFHTKTYREYLLNKPYRELVFNNSDVIQP